MTIWRIVINQRKIRKFVINTQIYYFYGNCFALYQLVDEAETLPFTVLTLELQKTSKLT